jgi:hypothetical protein
MTNASVRTLEQERGDVHNTSVNLPLALAGYCGMTHLCSGRMCIREARHLGSCVFRSPAEVLELLHIDPNEHH